MVNHWTGRAWLSHGQTVKPLIDGLRNLRERVITTAQKFGLRLYVETELIRGDLFAKELPSSEYTLTECLSRFNFKATGKFGGAKSDIHVEFVQASAVVVEKDFLSHCFYPVTGVDPKDHQPYVVYTLQTEEYDQGWNLYQALTRASMPGFREITIEQKLEMACSVDDLRMPEVIYVCGK
jgi:hypothetical protein